MAKKSKLLIMNPESRVASTVIFVIFPWFFTSGQNMASVIVSPNVWVIPPG
ncbi:hypothetical protein D3C76_1796550 [compost metagenome]